MLNNPRKLHRSIVPFAALPLIITATTGIIFSILDSRGIEADWLLEIHSGHFGPINLTPYYAYFLGLCVLTLVITGAALWWRSSRPRVNKA